MKQIAMKAGVLLVAAIFIAGTLQCPGAAGSPVKTSAARESWWDARWHYRMFVTVNSTSYPRSNYPVELPVNFAGHFSGKLDNNSVRVVQIGREMPSQYDPANGTGGTLIFVVNGTTVAHATRKFTVYYDTEGNGLKAVADYGNPDYVTEYKKLIESGKVLGSSPYNGSTDDWALPAFLGHGNYQYHNWVVGDVKAVMHSWGIAKISPTRWILHNADAMIYRDSFNTYVKVWNNDTLSEVTFASGLANISTGDSANGTADQGLNVITSNWAVNGFQHVAWGTGVQLAGATTDPVGSDTYDPGYHLGQVYQSQFPIAYAQNDYQVVPSGDHDVLSIISIQYPNASIVKTSKYSLDKTVSPRVLHFPNTNIFEHDGDQISVTYTRKLYNNPDELDVTARISPATRYFIMYDKNDKHGVLYEKPQIGAIIFPQQIAADNMVFEFWLNNTGSNTQYFLNISTNYKGWWYNSTVTHDPQVNAFNFIVKYMNGSSNPKQEVAETRDSYNNPAIVKIAGHESGIPLGLSIDSPFNGQMFNGWTDLPGNPMAITIQIRCTIDGDSVYRTYYTINDGARVDFNGTADVPVANVTGDPIDGRVYIKVTSVDTSGANMTKYVLIYVPKTFWQHLFSSVGSIFVVLITILGGVMGICGIAAIKKKKRAEVFGVPNI